MKYCYINSLGFIILHFLINFALAASASELLDETNKAELTELLLNCVRGTFAKSSFQNELESTDVTFTLLGKDDFRNVKLEFSVESGNNFGKMCSLVWDDWFSMIGNLESTISMTGTVAERGIYMDGIYGSNIQRLEEPTEIRIDIYKEPSWHWELVSLYPSNLVSAKFIRMFIVQGMKIHSELVQQPVFLRLQDISSIRESYWLESREGKTYFQKVWNMEYECFLNRMNHGSRVEFQVHSATAASMPAASAFEDKTFEPVKKIQTMTDSLFHFADIFHEELDNWLASKEEDERNEMTIREALDAFIPMWKGQEKYTQNQYQILAQNTFVYFFRHDAEFPLIATQVLQGYDDTCHSMRGRPKLDGISERQRIEYVYHGPVAPRALEHTPGNTPLLVTPARTDEASSSRAGDSEPPDISSLSIDSKRERFKVWIGGLPKFIKDIDVLPIVQKFGKVLDLVIRASRLDTFSFVEYEDEESAKTAIRELDGSTIKGAKVKVNWGRSDKEAQQPESLESGPEAPGPSSIEDPDDDLLPPPDCYTNKIWVTRLPKGVRERELKAAFEKYGKVTSIAIRQSKRISRQSETFAFIQFEDDFSAYEALREMNGAMFQGMQLRIRWARKLDTDMESDVSPPQKEEPQRSFSADDIASYEGAKPSALEDTKVIFIRNLAPDVGESDLALNFGKYGKIDDVRIKVSKQHRSDKFAFIDFASNSAASKAIKEMNNVDIKGYKVKVSFAKLSSPKASPRMSGLSPASEEPRSISPSPLPRPAQTRLLKPNLPLGRGSVESPSNDPNTIWVGGLPNRPITREKELRQSFEQYGEILSVTIRSSSNDVFALIKFAEESSAMDAAREMNGTIMKGVQIKVEMATERSFPNVGSPASEEPGPSSLASESQDPAVDSTLDPKKIWVGGLPHYTGESELKRTFEKFGTLVSVHIRSSFSDKFCFVEFEKESSASDAIREMDQSYFKGSKITLRYARRKAEEETQKPPKSKRKTASDDRTVQTSEAHAAPTFLMPSLLVCTIILFCLSWKSRQSNDNYYEEL